MKALITGSTGFAGSHLAEHLLACGDEVLGISRSGHWPGEAGPSNATLARVELLGWDMAGPISADVEARLQEFAPHCIYHLAGLSVPIDCGQIEPTARALVMNVGGTEKVLDLAARLDSHPRVLFASSCHVYAPVVPGRQRIKEDAPLGPDRAYGRTKQLAEEAVLRAVERVGVDAVVARAFHHTGPGQPARLLVPDLVRQIVEPSAEPIRIYNLDAHLDLSDVRDVVRAYRLLIQRGEQGAVYNVGSGIEQRSGDLLAQLCQLVGCDRPVSEMSPGRRQLPIADCDLISTRTGWSPQIPIEQTLTDSLAAWLAKKGTSA